MARRGRRHLCLRLRLRHQGQSARQGGVRAGHGEARGAPAAALARQAYQGPHCPTEEPRPGAAPRPPAPAQRGAAQARGRPDQPRGAKLRPGARRRGGRRGAPRRDPPPAGRRRRRRRPGYSSSRGLSTRTQARSDGRSHTLSPVSWLW